MLSINHEGDRLHIIAENEAGLRSFVAERVLVAAGCHDLAVPMPGWTLPGVHTAGAIQTLLKGQGLLAGDNILFSGTHPLQLVAAAQLLRMGGRVAGVLFAQPAATLFGPSLRDPVSAIRHWRPAAEAVAAITTLQRHGVPLRFGEGVQALRGHERVESALTSSGAEIACDAVGLCYGFVPQSALPRMAGASMRVAGAAGGWAAVHDEWMHSSVPGLHVAGETTGVAGAPAAAAGGAVAGIGMALALGRMAAGCANQLARGPRRRLHALLRFAERLDAAADPRPFLPEPGEETFVCRCEDVPCATVANAAAAGGSANSIKLATRCGMGACQGRNCEPTLLRLLAECGHPDADGFTQRFPVRPVTIGRLADRLR